MSSGTIQAEFIQVVGEFIQLKLNIPKPQTESSSVGDLHVMFAIDHSGSMSGEPLQDAKGAALSLIKKFSKQEVPITVFPFNGTHQIWSTDETGYDDVYAKCEALYAYNGTEFIPVIKSQLERILTFKYPNVYIVWLSDGQAENMGQLEPIFQNFTQSLENEGISCVVHAIGFGTGHDANVLTGMTRSGTRQGTFQYVEPGGRIPVAVNNIYELAFENSAWAKFIGQGGATVKRLSLEDNVDGTSLVGELYISEEDIEDCKLEFHFGKEVQEFELELQRQEARNLYELILTVSAFISSKVKECLDKQGDLSIIQRLQQLNQGLIQETERRLNDLKNSLQGIKVLKRKQIEPFLRPAFNLIEKFYEITASNRNHDLSNEELATMNALSGKVKLLKSLEKKIAKKAGPLLAELNQAEDDILHYQSTLNHEELEKAHGESASSLGSCQLSGRNWLQSVFEGDCLCATFEIDRPRGGLSDPNLFSIKSINPQLVTSDTFMNSKLFYGKFGMIIEGNSKYTQDQEPERANVLEPNFPDVVVSGLIPLYINEAHWEVGKRKLKSLLGWTYIVDVLGFEPAQLQVLPFMLLAKALSQYGRDHPLFQQIEQTALHIYRENRDLIAQPLLNQLELFSIGPDHRTSRHIKHLDVFLAQIHCAVLNQDVDDKIKTLLPRVFEELVRRNSTMNLSSREIVLNLLGINAEVYTQGIDLRAIFDEFRKLAAGEKVESQEENFVFNSRIEEFSTAAVGLLDGLQQKMKDQSTPIGRTIRQFELFGENPYTCVTDSGLVSNEQVLTLLIQSQLQKDDDTRITQIQTGKYIDPFDNERSIQYIQNIYTETVQTEIKNFKSKALKDLTGLNDQNAAEFAMAQNLDVAAQYLHGIHQGGPMFNAYYKKLTIPGIPFVIEKLKMLTQGHYEGRKLIFDKKKDSEFVTWIPKNNTLYRIWSANHDAGSLQEWQQAVPGKELYLEHQERRRNGEYVFYSNPHRNCKDSRHNWERRNKGGAGQSRSGKRGARRV